MQPMQRQTWRRLEVPTACPGGVIGSRVRKGNVHPFTPYLLLKISIVLQELEGFQYATALDALDHIMGHYTLMLDLTISDM